MLSGKKTYLVAAATILSAVAAALSGTMTWGEALALIVPAVLGATVRSGVSAEVAKTAAKSAAPLVLVALGVWTGGCTTSPQSAPQIPLAPVYQAGSPVVVNVNVKSDSTKQDNDRVGADARGDVGAQGQQENTPTNTTDVKPDITVPLTK